jgi:hypothetical protein
VLERCSPLHPTLVNTQGNTSRLVLDNLRGHGRAFQDLVKRVGSVSVGLLQKVRVDAEGGCGIRMPEPPADRPNRDARAQKPRRGEVTQVVIMPTSA